MAVAVAVCVIVGVPDADAVFVGVVVTGGVIVGEGVVPLDSDAVGVEEGVSAEQESSLTLPTKPLAPDIADAGTTTNPGKATTPSETLTKDEPPPPPD